VDSLNVSSRCGCGPNARQIRPTILCESPRLVRQHATALQCVAPAGRCVSVVANSRSTLRIPTLARCARTRFIKHPIESANHKTAASFAGGLRRYAQSLRHLTVAFASHIGQHDAERSANGCEVLPRRIHSSKRSLSCARNFKFTSARPRPILASTMNLSGDRQANKLFKGFRTKDTRLGKPKGAQLVERKSRSACRSQ
jgi:hypothetical protein